MSTGNRERDGMMGISDTSTSEPDSFTKLIKEWIKLSTRAVRERSSYEELDHMIHSMQVLGAQRARESSVVSDALKTKVNAATAKKKEAERAYGHDIAALRNVLDRFQKTLLSPITSSHRTLTDINAAFNATSDSPVYDSFPSPVFENSVRQRTSSISSLPPSTGELEARVTNLEARVGKNLPQIEQSVIRQIGEMKGSVESIRTQIQIERTQLEVKFEDRILGLPLHTGRGAGIDREQFSAVLQRIEALEKSNERILKENERLSKENEKLKNNTAMLEEEVHRQGGCIEQLESENEELRQVQQETQESLRHVEETNTGLDAVVSSALQDLSAAQKSRKEYQLNLETFIAQFFARAEEKMRNELDAYWGEMEPHIRMARATALLLQYYAEEKNDEDQERDELEE